MLYLCPHLYIHRWEQKNNGKTTELVIDIPKNIKQVLDLEEPPSNEALDDQMLSTVLEKRKQELKTKLYQQVFKYYEAMEPQFREVPGYVQFLDNFDYNESELWPYFFNYNEAPAIPKALLNEVPKTKKFETIADFLNKHDIMTTLLVTQSALSKAQEESTLKSENKAYEVEMHPPENKL